MLDQYPIFGRIQWSSLECASMVLVVMRAPAHGRDLMHPQAIPLAPSQSNGRI